LKDELKDVLITFSVMLTGFFARIQFGRSKFNRWQKLALLFFGTAIVVIVHKINIDDIYKLSIVMVSGLLLPNIVNAIISGGDKSEKKASDKISKNIDKLLD